MLFLSLRNTLFPVLRTAGFRSTKRTAQPPDRAEFGQDPTTPPSVRHRMWRNIQYSCIESCAILIVAPYPDLFNFSGTPRLILHRSGYLCQTLGCTLHSQIRHSPNDTRDMCAIENVWECLQSEQYDAPTCNASILWLPQSSILLLSIHFTST